MNAKRTIATVTAVLLGSALVLHGCAASPEKETQTEAEELMTDLAPGARLWAENCVRCHNLRPPDSYSDSEWDVVLHHMRLRAGLTADEHRAIADFLKHGF